MDKQKKTKNRPKSEVTISFTFDCLGENANKIWLGIGEILVNLPGNSGATEFIETMRAEALRRAAGKPRRHISTTRIQDGRETATPGA